ncbi:nicotinamide riboside kinase [Lewinella marina]|uniref:ATPase n=1 Tax=Neolewinella marina TaxID=438751 RepID=A0A2G0CIC5_9BACT|nr:ATP-binding protein [Neolewinella marina]NJB85133.1 nicotinamide riboside kinase [Neolewinella marina]PHK99732.1 ATPase [Neolewinella marina]
MRILVTGPESSGKSTLSRQLAWALDGIFVAEQARHYLQELPRPYTAEDLPRIWRRQRRAEEEALATGASFLVCDTGPEVIRVWSEVKYGYCDPVVLSAARQRTYDLTLLCRPDLPWSYDPLREHPDARDRMKIHQRYRQYLPGAVEIRGDNRLTQALHAVFFSLGHPPLNRKWTPDAAAARPLPRGG